MKLTRPQHQALGALASQPATDRTPQGSIRFGWFDSINATRRTCDALLRRGLLEYFYNEPTASQLLRLTQDGHRALREADEALRTKIEREQADDPTALTNDEYALLYRMVRPSPTGTDVARGLTALEWQQEDYWVRLSLIAKGYVCQRRNDETAEDTWHLAEAGAAAYSAAAARRQAHTEHVREPIRQAADRPIEPTGTVVVSLAPLQLVLSPEQARAWRDTEDLGPDPTDADVAADVLNFLQYNTLEAPDTWQVRRKGE